MHHARLDSFPVHGVKPHVDKALLPSDTSCRWCSPRRGFEAWVSEVNKAFRAQGQEARACAMTLVTRAENTTHPLQTIEGETLTFATWCQRTHSPTLNIHGRSDPPCACHSFREDVAQAICRPTPPFRPCSSSTLLPGVSRDPLDTPCLWVLLLLC